MDGYLWKKGKHLFHMLSKRYYLMSGNCMYYYANKEDIRPRGTERGEDGVYVRGYTSSMNVCMYVGVIFLTGSIIERIKDEDMQIKGYFGFEIMHQDLCTGHPNLPCPEIADCADLT